MALEDSTISGQFSVVAAQKSGKTFSVIGVFGGSSGTGCVQAGNDKEAIELASAMIAFLEEVSKYANEYE